MGKGGDGNAALTAKKTSSESPSALKHPQLNELPTEELRKWAKSYGLEGVDAEREVLLQLLVSTIYYCA